MRVSPTAADTFLKCQRRFWYEYLDPQRPAEKPEAPQMLPGLVHHAAYQDMVERPTLQPEDWATAGMARFMPRLLKTGIKIDDLYHEVCASIVAVRAIIPYTEPGAVECCEKRYSGDGQVGVIDLILNRVWRNGWTPGGRTIVDYKVSTGRARTPRAVALSPQLAKYAMMEGVRDGAIVEVYRDTSKAPRIIPVHYDDTEWEIWKRWWGAMDAAITARSTSQSLYEWPMTSRDNALCSAHWCPHHDKCYGDLPQEPSPVAQ